VIVAHDHIWLSSVLHLVFAFLIAERLGCNSFVVVCPKQLCFDHKRMAKADLRNALCTQDAQIPTLLLLCGLLELKQALKHDSENVLADKHFPNLILHWRLEHLLNVLHSQEFDIVV
jgi:hypothetical protein